MPGKPRRSARCHRMWSPSTAVAEKIAAVGRTVANSKFPWPWNVEKANAARSSDVGLLIPPLASGIIPRKKSSSCLPSTSTSGQVVGCSPPVAKSWKFSAGLDTGNVLAEPLQGKTPRRQARPMEPPRPTLLLARGQLDIPQGRASKPAWSKGAILCHHLPLATSGTGSRPVRPDNTRFS